MIRNRYAWRPWFAWYPVHAPGLTWLRWVERRIRGAIAPNGDLTDFWECRVPTA